MLKVETVDGLPGQAGADFEVTSGKRVKMDVPYSNDRVIVHITHTFRNEQLLELAKAAIKQVGLEDVLREAGVTAVQLEAVLKQPGYRRGTGHHSGEVAPHMCFVDGGGAPTRTHMNKHYAVQEAERLCVKTQKPVRVLRSVAVVTPVPVISRIKTTITNLED